MSPLTQIGIVLLIITTAALAFVNKAPEAYKAVQEYTEEAPK